MLPRSPRLLAAIALLCSSSAAAQVESFPTRPIRFVVPFTAAGIVDNVARTIAEKLSAKYGQPVVVENRAGAGGSIGTELVARSAPDGHTVLFVGTGFTVLPHMVKDISWSPADFRAVLGIGSVPNIVVVHPDVPVRNMGELVALARRSPDPLTYGSGGVGSSPHLSGEMLAQMADLKLTHVPYKGQPDAVTDLLGGRLTMMALTAALAVPHVKAGKLRAVGVTANTRIVVMPELATVAESAKLPDYDVRPWTGVFVPAKTPEPIVRKLATDMAQVLALPEVKAQMDRIGMELNPQPMGDFDRFIARESGRWKGVIDKAGLAGK